MASKATPPKPERPAAVPKKTAKPIDLVGRSLTRAITPEQINAGEQGTCRGLMRVVEVREVDEENRTVELAFSSTTPVGRWFGDEVLSHKRGAVKLGRLKNGGALLVGHDWDDQIGVVESARIDSDQVGRAVVRFGKSARAQEIFQDVADGIRRHVSVGYTVRKIDREVRDGQADLITVTEWEPFEISIVSVPADQSVGVGREMENPPEGASQPTGQTVGEGTGADGLPAETGQRTQEMKTIITRDAKGNKVRAKVDENGDIVEVIEVLERAENGPGNGQDSAALIARGREQEQTRVRELNALGVEYGAPDLALRMIDEGAGVEDMNRELLGYLNNRSNQRQVSDDSNIGLTDEEAGNFSFIRAIRALSDPGNRRYQEEAAFEREASDAAAQQMGRDAQGLMVPTEVLTRALSTSTAGGAGETGGYAIANPLLAKSFVEMLRNRSVLMGMATPLGGLIGNPDIPTQEGGAQGYWIGEDDDAPEGTQVLGQRQLSPKTVAAFSELTRRFLKQTSIDGEALVRRDLASALALTIDKAGFYGSGVGNEPLGIKNTNGVNVIDFGGAGSGGGVALPTWKEVIAMETEISADNADVDSMAYALNARMRGHFKSTEKFAGTSGQPIWEGGNTVNGYRPEVTNQIATGDLFFGNFADLVIGMWGGLDITVDPYTHSRKGRLRIVTMQDVDFVIRQAASFCYGSDAT